TALKIPEILYSMGTEKITFSGGEPMLCPHLGVLLEAAKKNGLTTMVVTNGTKISSSFLDSYAGSIDWIGISIDSSSEIIEKRLGRGNGNHVEKAITAWELASEYGIRLKLNTVVTSLTWKENMGSLIDRLKPKRWKVFQVLPVVDENDEWINWLKIDEGQFEHFIEQHRKYSPITENNETMRGSYVMIDPIGCVFQNITGKLVFGDSILRVPLRKAIESVGWNYTNFLRRGGVYKW
ncbi:MAG: viperin family antiviral radical SAM protein, partial [Candidatus Odinarchaeota archaeon]